jgi:hypothetical protein
MYWVRIPAVKYGIEWAFISHTEQVSWMVMYYGRRNVRILYWLCCVGSWPTVLAVGCVDCVGSWLCWPCWLCCLCWLLAVLTVLADGCVDCVGSWLCWLLAVLTVLADSCVGSWLCWPCWLCWLCWLQFSSTDIIAIYGKSSGSVLLTVSYCCTAVQCCYMSCVLYNIMQCLWIWLKKKKNNSEKLERSAILNTSKNEDYCFLLYVVVYHIYQRCGGILLIFRAEPGSFKI